MEKSMPQSYCGEIDFWKFICCIIIVIHHSFQIFGERIYMGAGSICVEFFFIVSGFFMASSVARRNEKYESDKIGTQTVDFLFHKISGFIYYYIFAVIACLAVRIPTQGLSQTVLNEKFALSITDLLLLNSSGLPNWYIFSASWYLSAMLMGMAVLYPLIRKNRDLFINIIAPITAVVLYSVMLNKDGFIGDPDKWYLIASKGFIRSIAGLCLGSVAYALSMRLKKYDPRPVARIFLSFIQFASMAFAVFAMYKNKQNLTVTIIFAFFICVVTAASKMTATSSFFNRPIVSLLGKLSITVYLCHQTVAYAISGLLSAKPNLSSLINNTAGFRPLVLLTYTALSVLLGIICLAVCSFISDKVKNKKQSILYS